MVSYQSEYTYVDGITTDIRVSGSISATMSRSYNSLGQLLRTTDAKGNHSYFAYNAAGLPVLIQDVLGSQITAQYDDLGRKAWFNDPNMGKWQFTYNQFGELATQTDAKNLVTTFTNDKLGRALSQTNTQTSRTWVYDTVVGNGKLYQAQVSGHTQTHSYDTAGRITSTVTQMGGLSFTERFAYDSQFGRLKAMMFPSGEHVAYKFDDNGYLIEDYQRFTDGTEIALRKVEDYSALGSINQQRFSNGNVQRIHRNEAGSATTICTSYLGSCSGSGIQYLSYAYDGMGNLARQENVITGFAEDYQYDVLMRVDNSTKTIKGVTMASVDYDYDAAGNILVKGDYGSNYRYGNSSKSLGGNAGPNALRQFIRSGTTYNFTYDNNGNRLTGDGTTLTYNDQNKPLSVVRNGTTSTFSYDANGNRFKQVKTQSGTTTTTYYVGSFEREVTASATIDKTYIGDHTIKMKAVSGSLGSQSAFSHVLRDHLGSVDTIMAASTGAVLQYRGYDVFGRPRDIATGNNLLSNWKGISRGYTDHEHLNEQELIHMNGRIYDYNVGRFLSVDPFLQFPENSQSANPYSYILNNPMSGTDPTGYLAKGTNASNWRTSECDLEPMGCQTTPADQALAKYTGNGQANERTLTRVQGFKDFLLEKRTNVTITDSGQQSNDKFLHNGEQHAPLVGDDAFDTSDETFHHYDTFTPFCAEGSKGCTYDILREDVLYHYSYPAEGLIATPAAIDDRPVVAYVVGPLDAAIGNTDDPSNYDTPVGRVVQIRTPEGGIQNQTLRDHGMYNGTITRQIISRNGMLGIWTHGIGVNKFISKINSPILLGISPAIQGINPVINFINKKLAKANDVYGPRAFAAMDAQAKQYWSNKYGN